MSFNHEGTYQCVCGKVFTNSQSFNGHKSHCKEHLLSTNKYGEYLIRQQSACELAQNAHRNNAQIRRNSLSEQWISEQHTCEKCGKIMTEKIRQWQILFKKMC